MLCNCQEEDEARLRENAPSEAEEEVVVANRKMDRERDGLDFDLSLKDAANDDDVDLKSPSTMAPDEDTQEDQLATHLPAKEAEQLPPSPPPTKLLTSFEEVADESVCNNNLFCDFCEKIAIFEEISKNPDGLQYCASCIRQFEDSALRTFQSKFLGPNSDDTNRRQRQAMVNAILRGDFSVTSSVTSRTDGDLTATLPPRQTIVGWSDLTTCERISRFVKKSSFCGQWKRPGGKFNQRTHLFGSQQAAQLELMSLHCASSSDINDEGSNGTIIAWSAPLFQLTFATWKENLTNDTATMKSMIPIPSKYLRRDDLSREDVVQSALETVATKLRGVTPQHWDCNRAILNHIADVLDQIATGEVDEFPWNGEDSSSSFVFSTREQFVAAKEEVMSELNSNDLRRRSTTIDILRRLDPSVFNFASEKTRHGNYGPPCSVTQTKLLCPREYCATYSAEAMFHGLCQRDDFMAQIATEFNGDPFAMPLDLKKELMKKFLWKLKVFPLTYTPAFLLPGSEFSVDAKPEEVDWMKQEVTKQLKKEGNLKRLQQEQQKLADDVRVSLFVFLFCQDT